MKNKYTHVSSPTPNHCNTLLMLRAFWLMLMRDAGRIKESYPEDAQHNVPKKKASISNPEIVILKKTK